MDTAADRFERRLSEEMGALRVDMAVMRVSLLRWMFAFWVGQLAATLGVVAMVLKMAKLI